MTQFMRMKRITENKIFKSISTDNLKSILRKLNKTEQSNLASELIEKNELDLVCCENRMAYNKSIKKLHTCYSVMFLRSVPGELRPFFKEIVNEVYKECK